MEITTDNVERDVLCWHDLTDSERAEFSYIDTEEAQDEAGFFRFQETAYDLGEFCRITKRSTGVDTHPCTLKVDDDSPLLEWNGYLSDSYHSMVLVRYVGFLEAVIVGIAAS